MGGELRDNGGDYGPGSASARDGDDQPPANSCTAGPSCSHRARVSAPIGAPAPATPPITAGMIDTIDAISGEPVLKVTPLESA